MAIWNVVAHEHEVTVRVVSILFPASISIPGFVTVSEANDAGERITDLLDALEDERFGGVSGD